MSVVTQTDSSVGFGRGSTENRLTRRRIYILPTRVGVMFVFVLGTMLLGSINYNASLGYVLTFWMLSLALVSIFHTYRNMVGLNVVSGRANSVFAGELATFELTLVNEAKYARHGVMVRFTASAKEDTPFEGAALLRTDVRPSDRLQLSLPVRAQKRGWLQLGSVTVSTRFPFGMFRAWSNLDTQQSAIIYPTPQGSPHLPIDESVSGSDGVSGGRGNDEYAGLRSYQVGDSMRQIHWKAAARTEELTVKEFEGTVSAHLHLDIENVPGSTESRLSQLCLWVLEAEAAGGCYGLNLGGLQLAPSRGETHMHRCLTQLALFGD